MLHCLHCVLWLEFRICGSSHKLFMALGLKKINCTLISSKTFLHFSLGQLMYSSWSWSLDEPLPFIIFFHPFWWLYSVFCHVSDFALHFKALEIILVEQFIHFLAALYKFSPLQSTFESKHPVLPPLCYFFWTHPLYLITQWLGLRSVHIANAGLCWFSENLLHLLVVWLPCSNKEYINNRD